MSVVSHETNGVSDGRRSFDRAFLGLLDRSADALTRHWLAAINTLTALLTGLAFVAPLFKSASLQLPAQVIYFSYSFMCHQLPQRSYFLFGYQVAQCQRNTAIYGAMCVAGIGFATLRHRIRPLDWRLYLLLILPMAVDGGTQLVGWRESDWLLRTATGALFGIATVWLTYPQIERSVRALAARERRVHRVVIFGKQDCSLCVKAKELLEKLQAEYPLAVEEVDITKDEALRQRYQYLIPVIHVDGRVAAVSKVSEVWLRRFLG